MTRFVAVTHHPSGLRLHVFGRRVHHADAGMLTVLWGLWWMARDLNDRADWFRFRRELTR